MEIAIKYLKSLLPETSYGKDSYAAFHQVLKGINPEVFRKWVSADLSRTLPLLAPKKLTLLHACAMLGRGKHAKILLDLKQININAQDGSGWTVLHFAAFINDSALGKLFVEHGALSTPNVRGALPAQLQELAYPPEKKVSFFYEDKGQIVEGDNQKFFELTGKKLVNEVVISRDELFKDWKENTADIEYVPQKWIEAYRKFKQSPPPPLYMTHTDIGWEVKTLEDLPAETIVGEYLGEYDPLPPVKEDTPPLPQEQLRKQCSYRVETTNGDKACNMTAIFNDGCPKLLCVKIYNEGGIKIRYFFITLEKCPKNTELRWNYIQHFVKHEAHQEVSVRGLIQTYKEMKIQHGPLDGLFRKISHKHAAADSDLDLSIDEQNIHQKIIYLFTTPQPLIIVAITQTISFQELLNCMEILKKTLKISLEVKLIMHTLSYLNFSTLSQQYVDSMIQIASTKSGQEAGGALISCIPIETIKRYRQELKNFQA